jgi:hypothetical protein
MYFEKILNFETKFTKASLAFCENFKNALFLTTNKSILKKIQKSRHSF